MLNHGSSTLHSLSPPSVDHVFPPAAAAISATGASAEATFIEAPVCSGKLTEKKSRPEFVQTSFARASKVDCQTLTQKICECLRVG